jgi:hypothetical protein
MSPQTEGLDARESTAALREGSLDRLRLGFGRVVGAAATERGWDQRDAMISLMPFVDCATRLGHDPAEALRPAVAAAPDWYREMFDSFVGRSDLTLAAFGWSVVETPEGPAYRFAWPS